MTCVVFSGEATVSKISEHSEDVTAGIEYPIKSITGRVGTGDWVVGTGEAIGSILAQMLGSAPREPNRVLVGYEDETHMLQSIFHAISIKINLPNVHI